jgi:nickel/cobalt transporter (NiCoT) family protein
MVVLPNDWVGLILIVFLLGLKHGMDPDHLATIDSLTRFNAKASPTLSRWSGLLFSLGHGIVVMLVAVVVGVVAREWDVPDWMKDVGIWISILLLSVLGIINLIAVFKTPRDQAVKTIGLKNRWLAKLTETSHPVLIAFIGALFALSFDTISQAALFSVAASNLAGWVFSASLGLVFTLGMMTTDGLNGWWVAHLINRADQMALLASRIMSLVVASLSLMIAGLGLLKYFSPFIAAQTEGKELLFGSVLIAIVAISFYIAIKLSRTEGEINS